MPSAAGTAELAVDLAVIGFGKGGKTLAAALAKAGKRVAMIEQSDQMYGGTCINIGCVPTKALVYQGEHPDPHLGDDERYATATTVMNDLTSLLRSRNFAMLDTPETSTVITGRARFVDPHTLLVAAGADRLRVTAETIVINTGARPALPAIPGLADSDRVQTSTSLLAHTTRPQQLIILGGGYVGVEFASMQAAFGVEVTVLQRAGHLLPNEDPDISTAVEDLLAEAGVRILTHAAATSVTDLGDSVRVTYTDGDGGEATVTGDLVLAALGRHPNTDDLGLEDVGIEVSPSGGIVVDDQLRTSLPHVFAVGDANGGPQFTYISLDDYRIVLDQLTGSGKRSTADRAAVPHVVFTTPPLARVGSTEAQARAEGRRLRIAVRKVADMATVPRARIAGDPRGVMKAVVDADTDELVGVSILAHDAHEIINTVALAIRQGIPAGVLRDEIYTHPSMTEALNDLLANLS